jgi:hypothetical protein
MPEVVPMDAWSLYERSAARIPFTLNGCGGQVAVYYGANDDPAKAGFDALAGLGFDMQLCRGYPVVHARIERYAGWGYRTFCGWIQVITRVDVTAHDPARAETRMTASVDLAPSLQASDMPFCAYGNLPQLFDAPCHNLGSSAQLRWIADTFLTTLPARSREEEIQWLLGFRWGYTETDILGRAPVLLPLAVTGPQAWHAQLATLRQAYPGWRFRKA